MKYIKDKVADKVEQYYKSGTTTHTYFLDPAEIVEVMGEVRYVEHCFWGGFEDSERKIVVIGMEEIIPNEQDFLTTVRVKSEQNFSHRSVLGSVLGLGIKREMIGDIIVNENICDIIVVSGIADFIINNLKFVGREKVSVSLANFEDILVPIDVSKEINSTVSSLRLDSVVSAGFGISREKSSALIKGECVKFNHVVTKSSVKTVRRGDLISVKGKGRLEVFEIGGVSKSGRIKIVLKRR